MHKNDSSQTKTFFLRAGLGLDRFALAPGLDVWLGTYAGTEGCRQGAITSELEIGVQLAGHFAQRGRRAGERVAGPGEVLRLSVAEPYELRYRASERDPGLIVGLVVTPEIIEQPAAIDESRELRFPATARPAATDQRLVELGERIVARRREGRPPPAEARAVVLEDLQRRCELSPPSPVIRGRKLLDRHFDCDLYLDHVAEEVGLHPATFARRFRQHYGVTPIQYRIKQRLNHATRMGWAEPELSVAEIARRVGFDHLPYFHRAFRAYLGTTPAQHRRNQPAWSW